MKAWFIWIDTEWGDFVHGMGPGKAKSMFWKSWSVEADEWIRLRAERVPDLDNVPLTEKNILKHLEGATFEGEPYTYWVPICSCYLCKE